MNFTMRGTTSILAMAVVTASFAQFTPGKLVATQVGDGSASLSNAAAPVALVQVDPLPASTVSTVVTLPSGATDPNKLVIAGTTVSAGFLNFHNGFFTVGGVDAVAGTSAVNGTLAAANNRVMAIVTTSGSVNWGRTDDAYSGDAFRSAIALSATTAYMGGTASSTNGPGVRYWDGTGTTTIQLGGPPTNIRVVNIFDGQLYLSNGAANTNGICSVGTGLPTVGGQTITRLPGFTNTTGSSTNVNSSPYDFVFADGGSTLYVADDRAIAAGGGIMKLTFNSGAGTWDYQYTMNGGRSSGVRCLTMVSDGATNTLAAVTAEAGTPIIVVTDTGSSSTFDTVATAATNQVFRGLRYYPASGQNLSGVVTLLNSDADWSNESVVIEIADSNGNVVQTVNAGLSTTGSYSAAISVAAGTYDVYIKGDTFLRELVGGVSISGSGASGVNATLINGDVNNDNEVGPGDFTLLSTAFGSSLGDPNYNAAADLNDDEEVGPGDFTILTGTFGQQGD